ncbi:DinB family protein [Sedimentitalea sp. JM2-8]|uniref:DinB family protein n=1 Tax=Sedimentitalea xiamensis TaxID=3050037 RepID=A0ABT7FGS7_9RHOB|nr:DinB family protein [Sedimentitalea xiamensis]MDK3074195.1 DinB family protein [Sedimentitalea xiamensis]
MIDRAFCIKMAQYNAWQNRQIYRTLDGLDTKDLTRDRGAFFGSILGTLNHLLWGDQMWMARLDGGAAPPGGIAGSPALHPTLSAWNAARFPLDGRIRLWAKSLRNLDLQGDLTWHSGATGRTVTRPRGLCVVHMFNHQTHHRGQVHAMMTAAGIAGAVSDLVFMPEDAGWR